MQSNTDNSTPKVLVITVSAWDNNNNLGNTLTNIFSGYPKSSIANLYCRTELPNNDVCDIYYRIAESDIIKNIIHRRSKCGAVLHDSDFQDVDNADVSRERNYYSVLRRNRFSVLLFLREILWKCARWKNSSLDEFIQEFNPDVIYLNFPSVHYIYDIFTYVKQRTNAKVVAFSDDDNYTLKQFSLSGQYWINRIALRKKVRSLVGLADLVYCINNKQKQEYEKIFKREIKLLYKTGDFNDFSHKRENINQPVRLVYAGNLSSGRWCSLARIGQALSNINRDGVKAQLHIYTQNIMTSKMRRALDIADCVILEGGIPFSKVNEVLLNADILIHVESFSLKSRLETRLSFSTKLVDYFQSGRCIFAVGWSEAASIDYLGQNDAAVIATSNSDIEIKLRELIDNPQLILDYGQKGWDCGKRNHHADDVKQMFWTNLKIVSGMDRGNGS